MTTNAPDDAGSNMSDDVFEDPETTQRRIEDRRRNEYANADYYARSSAYADGLSYDRDYCAQHLGSGGQSLRDATHRTAHSGYPGYRPPREAVLMYAFGEPGYKDEQYEEQNYCDGWKSYKYDDFEPPFDDTVNHKTILLGDSGVGKTSFLVKYNTGEFRAGSFSATVGIALTHPAAKMRRRSLGAHCGNPSATSYSTAATSTGSNLCRRASLRKPPSPVHRDPFERRESLVKPTWPNIKPGQLSPKTLEKVNGIGDGAECGHRHQHHHHHHHHQKQQQQQQQKPSSKVANGAGSVDGGGDGAAVGGSGSTSTGYESINESSDSSDESSCKPLRGVISMTRRYSNYEEILAKVMLLGDSGVGKTCLLIQFRDGKFLSGNFITTVGIDFRNKVVMVDSTRVKLQIWDTAGQERFRSVTHAYYRDAHALLLLYDVTNKTSFDNTRAWLVEIREYAQDDVVIMLLGNKADCSNSDRQVKREDGERLAREYNVAFMETSAKTGLNVELAFLAVARQLKCRRNESIDEAKFNVQDFVREQTQVKQTCSQCSK